MCPYEFFDASSIYDNIINVYTYYDNSGDFGGDLSLCYILNSVCKEMPFNLGVSRFVTHISMAVAVGIKVECYIVWNVTIVSLKESERRNMETRLE